MTATEIATVHPSGEIERIPVVTMPCIEPQGIVDRFIYLMPLNQENLINFWEKTKKYRTLLYEEVGDDFSKFINLFVYEEGDKLRSKGILYVLDDFKGVFHLTDMVPGKNAQVHVTMLDGRFRGRVKITQELLKYAFRKFGFHRFTVEIPVYVKPPTFKFIKELGFKDEGRMREMVEYKGRWFDCVIFGLLREEIL